MPYDLFAAVVSAHPVLTRRHADPGDKAEALFHLFLGRPPFEHERADMARLYGLWHSGYYDHPQLGCACRTRSSASAAWTRTTSRWTR